MWRAMRAGLAGAAVSVLAFIPAQAEDVIFSFEPPPGAMFETVSVRGSFNGWSETAMVQEPDGTWSVTIDLPPGEHQYKYFLNSEWPKDMENDLGGRAVDLDADGYAPDGYGGQNAVRVVGSPRALKASRRYGYRVEGDEIVFEFDVADHEFATRADGSWVDISTISLDGVAVAGEFNGWSPTAWPMTAGGSGGYELRRPKADFAGRPQWIFKFVANGSDWIEPPRGSTNVSPVGENSPNYNLVLYADEGTSILERLAVPESQLGGRCRLKPFSHAHGAPMIPMSSNPMITTDRDVIGLLAAFVMPPTAEEEAAYEEETGKLSSERGRERVQEIMRERAANVSTAYAVVYESSADGAETGMYALLFGNPIPEEKRAQLEREGPSGFLVFRGRVAVMVWADGRDTSCLKTLRAHVEDVLSR